VPIEQLNAVANTHDLPGETFRLLSKDVAYLKLSTVKADQAAKYIESAAGTKGLIIDIRNYPSEFMVFALGSLLVDQKTDFVRFTRGDLSNPGAFHFGLPLSLSPQQPHYPGKIVILVDEFTQSSAEYTTMAFRSSPRATVIGSTTAGADGNVSPIPLPSGFRSMISGIGVFYPDKKPTQRIGIVPDREVRPTIAGVRAGRDEVLEAAIREIVGKDVPAAQIEKMTKP
jgi:C-terminal processing protease CtpA/Prc